ncbi:hypothetical protein GS501_02455 [Saccharibacter sp. 17.LH.SD]|uniref:phage protease n=1 Tax=Saccharibacter sp. 17.LH.SD TaxID=2689393 RepID=UPI00136825D3|nr:phage protease [Saccharibacter sp. 17.LH.SD]MXV43914.1 hypothetical protein [Saccharibacter sp. 17.LH.SD]
MNEMTHLPLPATGTTPPEWIHLLPAGSFPAVGGRKTLRAESLRDVITASMKGGKIVLDENHSTDLAAPQGHSSPAMGWIERMEVRPDGIWGHVRWTKRGRTVMDDHGYRSISPVLKSTSAGIVTQILRAALTNNPDLLLTSLHSKTSQTTEQENSAMTYPLAALRSRLGLGADADEAAINKALDGARGAVSLHSQAAVLAGLPESASNEDVLNALKKQHEKVTLHAADAVNFQKQLDDLKAENNRIAAESWMEKVGRQKIISDDLRGRLLTLHASDPTTAEMMVESLPAAPSGTVTLHHGRQHNGTTSQNIPGLDKADKALGLTADDLKAGGLA